MYYILYDLNEGCAPSFCGIYTTEDKVELVRTSLAAALVEDIYSHDLAESGLSDTPRERQKLFKECYDSFKIKKIDKLDDMGVLK